MWRVSSGVPADIARVAGPVGPTGWGLVPRSKRPASCPHQMDPAVDVLVLEMRGAHLHWARRVLYELERAGVSPMPSRSGVYRALVWTAVTEVQTRRSRREPNSYDNGCAIRDSNPEPAD